MTNRPQISKEKARDALEFVLSKCYEAYQSNDTMIDMIGDAEETIRNALEAIIGGEK